MTTLSAVALLDMKLYQCILKLKFTIRFKCSGSAKCGIYSKSFHYTKSKIRTQRLIKQINERKISQNFTRTQRFHKTN